MSLCCQYVAPGSWGNVVSFHCVPHQLYVGRNDGKSFSALDSWAHDTQKEKKSRKWCGRFSTKTRLQILSITLTADITHMCHMTWRVNMRRMKIKGSGLFSQEFDYMSHRLMQNTVSMWHIAVYFLPSFRTKNKHIFIWPVLRKTGRESGLMKNKYLWYTGLHEECKINLITQDMFEIYVPLHRL